MNREHALPLLSRWDETPHGRMHARTGGPAPRATEPAVVLVHGLVISGAYMRPLAERLAPFVPVFAPDLPGFGRSDKPSRVLDVGELADALDGWLRAVGLVRVVLVGNSLGSQVISALAVRRQQMDGAAVPLIAGLVLTGPTIDARARTMPRQILRAVRDLRHERMSLTPIWAADFLRAGLRRSWKTFRHALDDRIEDRMPRVAVPTLVVRGANDPIVPQHWAEHVATLLPAPRLEVIANGSHAVNYSNADALAALVRTFLRELREGGR